MQPSYQNLVQSLKQGIANNNVLAIKEVERKVDFDLIMTAHFDKMLILKYDDRNTFIDLMIIQMGKFMELFFPEQEKKVFISEFSDFIFEEKYTWNLLDCLNFFKHIRNNFSDEKYKIFGNKLTFQKLIEWVALYENDRCEIFEKKLESEKAKFSDPTIQRQFNDASVKKLMGNEFEKIEMRNNALREKGKDLSLKSNNNPLKKLYE